MIGLNCVFSFITPMVKKNMKKPSITVKIFSSQYTGMSLHYMTAQIMLIKRKRNAQMQRKLFTLHEVHLNVRLSNLSCGF
jgi:hypothetical protein